MIIATDVQYNEDNNTALAAAVLFEAWADESPKAEYSVLIEGIEPYVPGEFYKRELPCLQRLIKEVPSEVNIDLIIVDGYVSLGDKPGLGCYLFEAMGMTIPIVGVAKSKFHAAKPIEVFRGESKNPLCVTAIGINVKKVAEDVKNMHGGFRMPTLLKRVDSLARGHF